MSTFFDADTETQTIINQVPALKDVAARIDELKKDLASKQISESEYKELIADLLDLNKIHEFADDLEMKTKIIKAAKVLIQLASLVV